MSEANVKNVKATGTANKNGNQEATTEKVGFWQKLKNGIKRNKKAIISGICGFGAGVGATIGVAEIGKRSMRKHNTIPDVCYDEPLDPNL